MGNTDVITKQYTSDNEVFADAFNYLIYHGTPVIHPGQLTELDTASFALLHGKGRNVHTVSKIRDVFRSLTVKHDANAAYVLLGIENQTGIHYAMPVRNMVYDALEYARQVTETANRHKKSKDYQNLSANEYLSGFFREDKLIPVITLVIHFSPEKWDAPLSIHEMLKSSDEHILSFTNDYRIHLLSPSNLNEEDLNKFHSSLKEVLGFIKYSRQEEKLSSFINNNKRFERISKEAASVINTCTGYDFQLEEDKEEINMCQAIADMKRHSFEAGMETGMETGMKTGMETGIKTGMEKQIIELIAKKLCRKKSVDAIADELEQELSYVQSVSRIISEHPEADSGKIYELLQNRQ